MEKWQNKIVLVTGASKGIGRAISIMLAGYGMKVLACARSEDKLKQLAQEFEGKKKSGCQGCIYPIKCDLSSVEDVVAMFKHIGDKYGALHACVNNAGMSVADYFLPKDTPDGKYDERRAEQDKMKMYERWRHILEVDVLSMAVCSKEALQLMAKSGTKDGILVNVSSIVGQKVIPFPIDDLGNYTHMYNSVKFAVTAMTECIRQEVSRHAYAAGIRVVTLYPGVVKTDFMDSIENTQKTIQGDKFYGSMSYLTAEQVAQALLAAFVADPNVQIDGITVNPTHDPHKNVIN